MKDCRYCQELRPDEDFLPNRRKCRGCRPEENARWRSDNRAACREKAARHRHKHPERHRGRGTVNYEIKKGTRPRASTLPCTDCPRPAVDYDHEVGYCAPHDVTVEPVCRPCHANRGRARNQDRRINREVNRLLKAGHTWQEIADIIYPRK